MSQFTATRIVQSFTRTIDAPIETVFPLLCPIREIEWIPGWAAEVIHSESGVVEPDGVFRASRYAPGSSVFVTIRHEPPRAVEYLVIEEAGWVERLALALTPAQGNRTELTFTRTFTGLSPSGNAAVQATADTFDALSDRLTGLLNAHCRALRAAAV